MYSENMIIKREHEIDEKLKMLKLLFKQRKLNSSVYYSEGWLIVALTSKDGDQLAFYYQNPILVFYIFYSILTYLSEHGGIEKWQIPKN